MQSAIDKDHEHRVQRFKDRLPLGYADYGDPHGVPIFALHGTPGSRLRFRIMEQTANKLSLRIIAPDRRGYGLSPQEPQSTLTGFAEDIAALADALQLKRFGILGVSGGAPFAVASAALLGERVTSLGLVSPVGPVADSPAKDEIALFHEISFLLIPKVALLLRLFWKLTRFGLNIAPNLTLNIGHMRAPVSDWKILERPAVRDGLATTFQEGLRPGVNGALQDMMLFSKPWNIPWQEIKALSKIWIGSSDGNVPLPAVKELSKRISGCQCEIIPDAGHQWISQHYQDVLEWFVEKACLPNESRLCRNHG